MNYDFFAEDAEIIYNQKQLLLKLYENIVHQYDELTIKNNIIVSCGIETSVITELKNYMEKYYKKEINT